MKISRWLTIPFLLFSALGLLDATYLTIEHYIGVTPPCFIVQGCPVVLTSKWSILFGQPISLFGAVFYLILFVLCLSYLTGGSSRPKIFYTAALLTPISFATSAFLMYIQFFVIKQICVYCTFSAIFSTILFGLGMTTQLNLCKKPMSSLANPVQ